MFKAVNRPSQRSEYLMQNICRMVFAQFSLTSPMKDQRAIGVTNRRHAPGARWATRSSNVVDVTVSVEHELPRGVVIDMSVIAGERRVYTSNGVKDGTPRCRESVVTGGKLSCGVRVQISEVAIILNEWQRRVPNRKTEPHRVKMPRLMLRLFRALEWSA